MFDDSTVPPRDPATDPVPTESASNSSRTSWPATEGYGGVSPEPDWSYYPRAIYRRRWTALTVLLAALIVGVMRNVTAIPVYEARVRVLVEPERVSLIKIDDPVSNGTSADANLAILRSRWLVRKTLESMGSWPSETDADPAPIAAPPVSLSAIRSAWLDVRTGVSRTLGLSQPPAARLGETAAQAARIDGFLGGLNVAFSASGLLDITYRSSDALAAAKMANAHAEQYIAQNTERRFEAVKEVTDWLAVRLTEQRQKLNESEQALAQFRDEHHLSVSGAEDLAMTRVTALSGDLTKARTVRLEKEAVLNRALSLRADSTALDRMLQNTASTSIPQLRGELERVQRERAQHAQMLRELHPDMIKRHRAIQIAQSHLDDERTRVIALLRDELGRASAAETALSQQLGSEKAQASTQNSKGLQLSILTREVESNRQIYDMLVQRTRDADIAKDINPSRMRILDPALVPQRPISPNKMRDLMLALAMGVGLAMLLPLGFEFLDNRIKSPEELQASIALPFLGLIPEHHARGGQASAPLITNGVSNHFLEALRHLRTNIVFSFPEGRSRSMVITSAGPAEGKTVVASNVAIGLGQLGQRVLLIDGDMRRPKVHEFFDVAPEPGLSNLLIGEKKASEVVIQTQVPNVWVLAAGHRPPNPCDLLGSDRFKTFLASLKDHFDWILIDAPPVLAVTDACVAGHAASGVLFVVGAERVTRPEARRAIGHLMAAQARFAGVVLSRVELDRHAYYYSRYYSRKYTDYYAHPSPVRSTASVG